METVWYRIKPCLRKKTDEPKGQEYDYNHAAVQGVEYCTKLFKLEETFKQKGYSHEKIKELRLQKAKPILEAFWYWIENQSPIRNSRMDQEQMEQLAPWGRMQCLSVKNKAN